MHEASAAAFEEWVLTTEPGRRLLDQAARTAAPGPAELARWRQTAPAEAVAAALRLAEARRRGAAKFTRAGRMWLVPRAVEQATAEVVARHKAARFAGNRVVDLCAGIGGDSLALAAGAEVLAIDRDEAMCRRCRWNAVVYEVAERVTPIRAAADRFPIPPGALIHIDPDRRARPGHRARSLRDYVPGLEFLRSLPAAAPGGAIKVGPASDFDTLFEPGDCEIELVSLAGECKEATVWFGSLTTCRRRATRLPGGATWTDRDAPATGATVPVTGPLAWIFDPDPALLRSGLLEGFAAAHGLSRCAGGVDYLTAAVRVDSPWLDSFEVQEVLPLDHKRLRRRIHESRLGPLEIKIRGLDTRPETLRARLGPPGPQPATLLLYGGGGPARAVIARRATPPAVSPR